MLGLCPTGAGVLLFCVCRCRFSCCCVGLPWAVPPARDGIAAAEGARRNWCKFDIFKVRKMTFGNGTKRMPATPHGRGPASRSRLPIHRAAALSAGACMGHRGTAIERSREDAMINCEGVREMS